MPRSRTLPLIVGLALLSAPGPAAPQARTAGGIIGTVVVAGRPLAGASVRVESEGHAAPARTATAAGDGRFTLAGLPPGRYTVTAHALGYVPAVREVDVEPAALTSVLLTLEDEAYELDPVVVTATLSEVRVSETPVKVDVVPGRVLRRHASSSLMQAVGRVNGLYEQVDCGVCYTNNIRINGMEGPYTAVLVDGTPIMGALASVYGLNGIHPSLVERLEILKGPQSTLYGTEAMGGVVNVVTKDARFAPRFAVEAKRTDLGETDLSFSWAPGTGRGGSLLSGSLVYNGSFHDENGDAFSDLTLDTRLSLFGKTEFRAGGRRIGGITAKAYYEDRFGGVEGWTAADRGSSSVYGESIRTYRAEAMGSVRLPLPDLRAEASIAYHRQDSWYGDTEYAADQEIGFGQILWDPPRGEGRHDLLLGATLRVDGYDDNTPVTAFPSRRWIPGVFAEDQVALHPAWTLLGGVRVDRHAEHGAIVSPRGSLMWRPTAETTFRLNAGTGFRVVHLFTEDHAALTGAREVVITEELLPERSRSLALNANRILEFGANPMMIDVDVFHTSFSNRIRADYDVHPNQIVYRNLHDRTSVSRGFAVSLNQNFGDDLPLQYTAGITVQDVYLDGPDDREREFYTPEFRGVWNVSYAFGGPESRLTLDWGGSFTGAMRLPEYPEPFSRPTTSESYLTHDVEATWTVRPGQELVLGVRNLTDFRQGSPLVDPGNPFGESFDTSYVWGPIVGRRVTFGFRWLAGR